MCKRAEVSFIPEAAPTQSVPLEAQQTWVSAGSTQDVAVPDCKAGQFLSIDFKICTGALRQWSTEGSLKAADCLASARRLVQQRRRPASASRVLHLPRNSHLRPIRCSFASETLA